MIDYGTDDDQSVFDDDQSVFDVDRFYREEYIEEYKNSMF